MTTSRVPVTAAIISRNEEAHIARCLESVSWAAEILVIDAGSTDATPAICMSAGKPWSGKLRLINRAWTGFRDQRNLTLVEAKNDWILVIDADEKCSEELASRIQTLLTQPGGPGARAFKVKRVEYFLGKPIEYGIWNPSYQDRFFHRAGVKYVNDVHEYPIFPAPPQTIHEPILHSPDLSPDKLLDKMNRYTTIEARDRVRSGQRTNAFRMIAAFPAMFLKNYFYYSAYKDGIHGFVISILEGISRAVRHIKIWQFSREESRKP